MYATYAFHASCDHGTVDRGANVNEQTLDAHSRGFAKNRTDPTRTKTLRDKYAAEMYRRFRELKGVILHSITEQDAFGLQGDDLPTGNADEQATFEWFTPAGPKAFDFPSNPKKIEAFDQWLHEQARAGLLEVVENPAHGVSGDTSQWQNTYIRRAYAKGVTHADMAAKKQGVQVPDDVDMNDVFRAPKHAEAAGMLYSRAYSELKGVTESMAQDMRRVLSRGFTQGLNGNEIGRELNERVENVGLHRGRLIARTEVIRTHNEAALNRYEQLGFSKVEPVVEFAHAGDARVCAKCRALGGQTFSIDDARGVIPVHPNCRCTFIPVRNNQAS